MYCITDIINLDLINHITALLIIDCCSFLNTLQNIFSGRMHLINSLVPSPHHWDLKYKSSNNKVEMGQSQNSIPTALRSYSFYNHVDCNTKRYALFWKLITRNETVWISIINFLYTQFWIKIGFSIIWNLVTYASSTSFYVIRTSLMLYTIWHRCERHSQLERKACQRRIWATWALIMSCAFIYTIFGVHKLNVFQWVHKICWQ